MRTQADTTQRKTKANNQQKSGKDPLQRGHGYEMSINDDKEDLR
jgi:hypothetical protein